MICLSAHCESFEQEENFVIKRIDEETKVIFLFINCREMQLNHTKHASLKIKSNLLSKILLKSFALCQILLFAKYISSTLQLGDKVIHDCWNKYQIYVDCEEYEHEACDNCGVYSDSKGIFTSKFELNLDLSFSNGLSSNLN